MKYLFLLLSLLVCNLGIAQNSFHVVPVIDGEKIVLDQTTNIGNGNLAITNCRFYLSNIQFFDAGKTNIATLNDVWLVDLKDSSSIIRNLDVPESASYIQFGFGIDSNTNVSGAYGGDLDPTKGMYWSWQSGYINLKLEGTFIGPRPQKFEYHIGGFMSPNRCYEVSGLMPLKGNIIEIDFAPMLLAAQKLELDKLMRPSKETKVLAKAVTESIQLK